MAGVLARNGVGRGERVVVQVDKSVGNIALYLACLRLGAVYVPLNTAYTDAEVAYFIGDARPRVFVGRAGRADVASLILTDPETGLWADALAGAPLRDLAERTDDDLAAIVYTSGTTGRSKGAMLSHRNLAANALTLHRLWRFQPGDVLLHALPVYHVHGLFVALHCAFLNASEILFMDRFDVGELRRLMPLASVLMGVPTFYTRLMAADGFDGAEVAHMRLLISGSAPLTAQAHAAFEAATGQAILERYGMTEAGMITSNPYDGPRIAGTVGYALPDVEVRVCDGDGRVLPPGETGVVEVRGPSIFKGYWGMPDKTADDFRPGGWFITGDLGVLADDGRLTIVGRAKDLIISGGLNIYPREIEALLDAIDGIAESAVIGVPDADMGEAVVAVLVPS
ncbi:MAG: malonyl-CoA synthase, partial [Gemmatimonadetes bacterium]